MFFTDLVESGKGSSDVGASQNVVAGTFEHDCK